MFRSGVFPLRNRRPRLGLWSRLKGLVSERVDFKMTEIRPDWAYYILLSQLNQMMQEGLLYRQPDMT
jgi:hypothetical protein